MKICKRPLFNSVGLRPGHFESSFHIQTLQYLFNQITEINLPFIIVAENKPEVIKIRVRQF